MAFEGAQFQTRPAPLNSERDMLLRQAEILREELALVETQLGQTAGREAGDGSRRRSRVEDETPAEGDDR